MTFLCDLFDIGDIVLFQRKEQGKGSLANWKTSKVVLTELEKEK